MEDTQHIDQEIAIIGLAGRFPGARNIEEFWHNLRDGVESIIPLSDDQLRAAGVPSEVLKDPDYIKAKGILADVDQFDAAFFGLNAYEAAAMDPQQRLFLETAWHALEHAGYDPMRYKGRIGVYAGVSMSTYLLQLLNDPAFHATGHNLQTLIGNDKDYLTTRVSYMLNLRGPSITVQTACSSALVAVHLATQALLDYHCDVALAGGVSISIPQVAGYYYHDSGITSPDGHCRAFDAQAHGVVFGSGVGLVALKRLEDALADGDYIHAVIKGSAVNNDGANKIGYAAPSVEGQASVIAEALAAAEIPPETIGYIEAHGTATSLGDAVEVAALKRVFRNTGSRSMCGLGSVKTNIGHLDTASGIAGLIKTVLALKHKQIPPSLHFKTANPKLELEQSRFFVPSELTEWSATPRRAGVSSFGIGGTNAHVVLEEAPLPAAGDSGQRPAHLLIVSGRTATARDTSAALLVEHLGQQDTSVSLSDVAYTLQHGRRAFAHRLAVACHSAEDAIQILEARDPQRVRIGAIDSNAGAPLVSFMLPGLGDHYAGMGRGLYDSEPVFRAEIDRCAALLKPYLDLDLREVLYPAQDASVRQPDQGSRIDFRQMVRYRPQTDGVDQPLSRTSIAQPATFVIEYALAKLWESWGVKPQALLGYSVGEYVAACLAGVLTLDETLEVVARRAQLIEQLPRGAMLAVACSADQVRPLLDERLFVAALNGPNLCVVAGDQAAITDLHRHLTSDNVACQAVGAAHAFHTPLMDPIVEPFKTLLKQRLRPRPPRIPYLSNVTGTWITTEQALDPTYWAQHLREPVQFAGGVQNLIQRGGMLLEVGPGQTLCSIARQYQPDSGSQPAVLAVPSMRPGYDQRQDLAVFLDATAQLWVAGVDIVWDGNDSSRGRRLPLPVYPFEHKRYWLEATPTKISPAAAELHAAEAVIGRPAAQLEPQADLADWFYVPGWRQAPPLLEPVEATEAGWLVLIGTDGPGRALEQRLAAQGAAVFRVMPGTGFARVGEREYLINPSRRDNYVALLRDLQAVGQSPTHIVHCWTLDAAAPEADSSAAFHAHQPIGFYSLLFLAQALHAADDTRQLQITVIGKGLHAIESADRVNPANAPLLGMCTVIGQEYQHTICRCIDVAVPRKGSPQESRLIDALVLEIRRPQGERMVAYRGVQRWVRTVEALPLPASAQVPPVLRPGGTYLITGGLGNIGLVLAEYLARSVRARLVLTSRSGLPAREDWEQWVAAHRADDATSAKIRAVQALEAHGAEVVVAAVDVAAEPEMQQLIAQVERRFGQLHGVIHAAGLVGIQWFNLIPETGEKECEQHFRPKVDGLYVLERMLADRQLDFCLLISSISSLLGGLGFAAYASANAVLDAMAHAQRSQSRTPWISLDWAETDTPEQIAEIFARTVAHAPWLTQVAFSPTSLRQRMATWVERSAPRETATQPTDQARPNLPAPTSTSTPPSTELEQRIAVVWREVLGVTTIGVHDNFFLIGGHSLLATQIVARLRQMFGVSLSLQMLFEMPTIAGIALLIEDALLREIEELSEASEHEEQTRALDSPGVTD